jgi:alpha-tubulin suppressor-like RCC1 family protein
MFSRWANIANHDPYAFLEDGLALNAQGEVFSWGKGERGQLGHDTIESESPSAIPILKAVSMKQMTSALDTKSGGSENIKPHAYHRLGRVSQISAGMIHSAALEAETNQVFIWGKNTVPPIGNDEKGKHASDARLPVLLSGLPKDRKVLRLSCGSHHTSVLLDDASVWAVGVATDTKVPVHEPVCLIEAGIIDLPTMTQFAAHMDRTTVVFGEGRHVLQVHLWSDVGNQNVAVFTPAWVDELLENDADLRIREVHRSWLHTVVVTEKS